MFRKVFPSIIRSSRLYIQHQVYVIQTLRLLASGKEMELKTARTTTDICQSAAQQHFDICLLSYVQF